MLGLDLIMYQMQRCVMKHGEIVGHGEQMSKAKKRICNPMLSSIKHNMQIHGAKMAVNDDRIQTTVSTKTLSEIT